MIKRCENCGEEFEAKRSDAKYCSKKCRQLVSVRAKRAAAREQREARTCPICGNKFNDLTGGRQYCSEDCSDWAQRLQEFRKNEDRYDPLNWIDDEDPFDSLG